MKILSLTLLSSLPLAVVTLHAQDHAGPIIPGTNYQVHDLERPQPRVVETAGAVTVKPPADAIVLFDGSNLDAWVNPKWKIEDGVMIASERKLISKQEFGPIQFHAEWRVPAGRAVDGQKGGNSGIFFMGLYEIQVLQSNNNQTYPDGQAGALYGQQPPLVNVTSAQGEWNSYDIVFQPPVYGKDGMEIPAKVTVIHNGVVIQNAETFLGLSTHKRLAKYPETHPVTGPITLQFHQDPIEYKNIWVRPLGERDGK